MLKPSQLGRVLKMQATLAEISGDPGMAVPRDRLSASWYHDQNRRRQRVEAKKAAAGSLCRALNAVAQQKVDAVAQPAPHAYPPFPAMRAARKLPTRQPGK